MSDLARLILARGQQQADWQREKYDRLGNAVANLGSTIGGAIEQKREAQALAKRDAAWASFVENWTGDPREAMTAGLKIFGPTKEGAAQVQAVLSAGNILRGQGKPEDPQRIVNALRDKPDAYWERAWPMLRKVGEGLGYPLGEQYSPDERKIIEDAFPAPKADLQKVETVDAQGRPVTQFVNPTAGASFAKPQEQPKDFEWVTRGGRPVQIAKGTAQAGDVPYSKPDTVSASDYEWVMRGGKPTQIVKGTAQPGDTPYESPRSGVKKIPAGVAQDLSDMRTSIDEAMALGETLPGQIGAASWAGAQVPDVVTATTGIGEQSKITQAEIDKVKQIIGKALEGGVLRKEDELKYAKILPKIGDTEAIARSKVKGLIETISKKRQRQIESLTDAGYDMTGYDEPKVSDEGWQERPGGIRVRLKPGQ